MRIGFLGPIGKHANVLEEVAGFFLDTLRVERVTYLGSDPLLEQFSQRWAAELTDGAGAGSNSETLWQRTLHCLDAEAASIDRFIDVERRRREFERLTSLSAPAQRLTLRNGLTILCCQDRDQLDPDELSAAKIVVYGNATSPSVKQVGQRFFLAPGSLDEAGLMMLEEGELGLRVTLFNQERQQIARHSLIEGSTAPKVIEG